MLNVKNSAMFIFHVLKLCNLPVPLRAVNFLTTLATVSFSRRFLFSAVLRSIKRVVNSVIFSL